MSWTLIDLDIDMEEVINQLSKERFSDSFHDGYQRKNNWGTVYKTVVTHKKKNAFIFLPQNDANENSMLSYIRSFGYL